MTNKEAIEIIEGSRGGECSWKEINKALVLAVSALKKQIELQNGCQQDKGSGTRKERVYISGAITGTTDYMERFAAAEKELKECGFAVVNPAKINAQLPAGTTWREYMKVSITLLKMCDQIYMLPGWQQSKGAKVEYKIAEKLGIPRVILE